MFFRRVIRHLLEMGIVPGLDLALCHTIRRPQRVPYTDLEFQKLIDAGRMIVQRCHHRAVWRGRRSRR